MASPQKPLDLPVEGPEPDQRRVIRPQILPHPPQRHIEAHLTGALCELIGVAHQLLLQGLGYVISLGEPQLRRLVLGKPRPYVSLDNPYHGFR